MNENGKLQNILHCTDNDTIDKIAEKYTLSDEATSQRVYERCVQKMMAKKGENSGYTEMFITEKYKPYCFNLVHLLLHILHILLYPANYLH